MRSKLVLAAIFAVAGCQGDQPAKTAEADPSASAQPDAAAKEKAQAEAWAKRLASRTLAKSGLGVGGKLAAFEIVNCETGAEYCQVCKFGNSPKIMAVGTSDDEAFRNDLKQLDALVAKYGADKVKAFAVVTDIVEGKAVTPKDAADAKARAETIKKELALSFPVVVPATLDGRNKIWEEYYNITESRTVMFSNGRNEVKYSAIAPEDMTSLESAVSGVVGPPLPAAAAAEAPPADQAG